MPHTLILKVTKFQLSPPKRLGTVVKNVHFIGLKSDLLRSRSHLRFNLSIKQSFF